jgi:hypothetical protein
LLFFGQYGLRDHIDSTAPLQGNSDRVQNNYAIVSWLYNRLAPHLLTAVSTDNDTAYSLWRDVREIFHDKRSARAVYFNAEFRTFLQGDLSVLVYCTRMKAMADQLGDLGSPITNADLVQNIIRGLNPRLHHYIPHLTLRRRLPSFHKARSMLQMEQHRLAESAKLQAASALIALAQHGVRPPPPVYGTTSGSSPGTNTRSSTTSSPSKKKRKKHTTSSGSSSMTPRGASSSVPTGFSPNINSWTGVVQAWSFLAVPRPTAGLLGARPATSAPQVHVASSTPLTVPTSQLDPQLLASLTNLSVQHSSTGGDWFIDTGASTHMASGPGNMHSLCPNSSSTHIIVGDGSS